MMQKSHQGVHPGKSSVMFLPMIDMSASDVTCIYSTLEFISSHARRYNVTPIITFDQPLWWKALNIIDAEPVASKLPPMSNHRVSHLHQMLQSITAYVCIARYSNGRAPVLQFHQQNGDGVRVMVDLFLYRQTCHLRHKNCFV